MSRLRFHPARLALALAVALAATACSDVGTTPTTTGTTTTETFTGTLTPNGGTTFSFVASTSGTISATLTSVSPDSTLPIGFALGTWNSTSLFCTATVFKDNAVQGNTISGAASLAGSYCVHVYDASSTVMQTESIQIDVSHP